MEKQKKELYAPKSLQRTFLALTCAVGIAVLPAMSHALPAYSDETFSTIYQQQGSYRLVGTVADESGETLPGVNISVKDASHGTITDLDGKFTLNVTPGETLVVSFIGMITQEIRITGQKELNIRLVADTKTLDEVVVIGYGVVKKKDLTGAVAGLKENQLDQQSNGNVGGAIQGKIAGVTVESASGAPG